MALNAYKPANERDNDQPEVEPGSNEFLSEVGDSSVGGIYDEIEGVQDEMAHLRESMPSTKPEEDPSIDSKDDGLINPKTEPDSKDAGLINPKTEPSEPNHAPRSWSGTGPLSPHRSVTGGEYAGIPDDSGGQEAVDPQNFSEGGSDGVALGSDQIVEEAPGIDPAAANHISRDPGDLTSFGRSAGLPDLGVGDESAVDNLSDPGGSGSDLFGDLDSGVPDPTDPAGGAADGWSPPVIDDQSGWAMDGDGGDDAPDSGDKILDSTSGSEFHEASEDMYDAALEAYEDGDDIWGDFLAEAAAAAETAAQERWEAEESQTGPPPGHGNESMPIPDEFGTGGGAEGGELDTSIMADVDPAPDADDGGRGAGELVGGRGDVDPDPELEDPSGGEVLDAESVGLGAIDPIGDGSTLLGGDAGDLADIADAGDVELEFTEFGDADADLVENA